MHRKSWINEKWINSKNIQNHKRYVTHLMSCEVLHCLPPVTIHLSTVTNHCLCFQCLSESASSYLITSAEWHTSTVKASLEQILFTAICKNDVNGLLLHINLQQFYNHLPLLTQRKIPSNFSNVIPKCEFKTRKREY